MKARNDEIAAMVDACERHLDDMGLLGYACARNARLLTLATVEYAQRRERAVREFGSEVRDASGNVTGYTINPFSENWRLYRERMGEFDAIEHEVDVFKIKAEDIVGAVSGKEMLALDFMLDWGDGDGDTDAQGVGE